jgi:hypothetical protein
MSITKIVILFAKCLVVASIISIAGVKEASAANVLWYTQQKSCTNDYDDVTATWKDTLKVYYDTARPYSVSGYSYSTSRTTSRPQYSLARLYAGSTTVVNVFGQYKQTSLGSTYYTSAKPASFYHLDNAYYSGSFRTLLTCSVSF